MLTKPVLFTGDIKDLIPDGMNNGFKQSCVGNPTAVGTTKYST